MGGLFILALICLLSIIFLMLGFAIEIVLLFARAGIFTLILTTLFMLIYVLFYE